MTNFYGGSRMFSTYLKVWVIFAAGFGMKYCASLVVIVTGCGNLYQL